MVTTVGDRIREKRESSEKTQQYVAQHLKISRSAIAQWESNTTHPSLKTLEELALLLNTTPEFLAFNISEDGTRTVYRSPENSGLHTVDIVTFDKNGNQERAGGFAIDDAYLKDISSTGTADELRGFIVPANGLIDGFKRGDRVVIDTSVKQPRQPGVYAYWNGFDASLAQMSAGMADTGPVVRIVEGGQTSNVDLSKLKILGKVVAHWSTL